MPGVGEAYPMPSWRGLGVIASYELFGNFGQAEAEFGDEGAVQEGAVGGADDVVGGCFELAVAESADVPVAVGGFTVDDEMLEHMQAVFAVGGSVGGRGDNRRRCAVAIFDDAP